MKGFLEQFFPETIGKEATSSGDLYCTYNNQKIQWFTSSLFLAGAATEISGTTGGLRSWTGRSHLMNLKACRPLSMCCRAGLNSALKNCVGEGH